MQQQKVQLITMLGDLLAGRNEVHGGEVLKMVFFYCRDCRQQGIQPTSLFTPEERKQTDEQIIDSFPLLRRDLQHRVNTLGWESAMYLRIVRSGIEFIRENFTVDNAWLEHELDEFIFDPEVQRLNQQLESFKDDRGEYDSGDDPVDLRGVPDSHHWWSDLERGDSIRVFGR